ncbi:TetR/AcrR family transcriptional regulator [Mycolicibacterium sediminis]|uniref:Putative transcriptional regulator, TetR family protein n=1 Tax=Mycolicibacterium sediminis TaxID=1286180 RepID=A0A7I7QNK5_9MYCO|nr:TetR/AcrR family transcriptional regulator [Mycolicibacterium sediminis]BBY27600.1 putative transcriptional regulator, TetR family protein [Mycolicibacterium sediminis]
MATTIDRGGDKRRQTRSVATRRRILDSAVRLFARQGYSYTGTSEIIANSGMTGGAFYHHFDGKESVAEAILVETNAKVHHAYTSADDGGSALEAVIRGTFAVAYLHVNDAGARVSSQLMETVGRATGHSARHFDAWTDAIGAQLRLGQAQGDVRGDVDPEGVGRSIASAAYGVWAVASFGTNPSDLVDRLAAVWDVILQGIVVADVAAYFRGYLFGEGRQFDSARLAAPHRAG